MSKTRVRYDLMRGRYVAAHKLSVRERMVRWFWLWAERYCDR